MPEVRAHFFQRQIEWQIPRIHRVAQLGISEIMDMFGICAQFVRCPTRLRPSEHRKSLVRFLMFERKRPPAIKNYPFPISLTIR